jgi:hypothetical protein
MIDPFLCVGVSFLYVDKVSDTRNPSFYPPTPFFFICFVKLIFYLCGKQYNNEKRNYGSRN